ncbi:hypothetical protein [Gimesia maris]|uniref:hypothetical protein n=1 Tax=Gimesia maris TaxID=122 RepID=UPI0032EF8596
MKDNLKLWDAVQQTDPKYTKKVTGKSFNGTSPNPMYLVKKATEHLGPMGEGWGCESICTETETIGDTILYSEQVLLWYMKGEKRCEISQWSSIKLAYMTKGENGYLLIDEEARKKCRTNAMSKCLSLLGFCADIWLKYYESDDYVKLMQKEHERVDVAQENATKFRELTQNLETKCGAVAEEEKLVICQWILDDRELEIGDMKINPALTVQIKEKLAEEFKKGVKPKSMLKSALEWSNGNSTKES